MQQCSSRVGEWATAAAPGAPATAQNTQSNIPLFVVLKYLLSAIVARSFRPERPDHHKHAASGRRGMV
jgi:hypothetical protein